jgi:exosortase A-associated hydrolase 2
MSAQPFFLPSCGADGGPGGQRLCIHHPAQGVRPRAAIVYAHPFAEEMNKSRRMAALAARAFARDGCEVLQMDLLGCGDSSGEFGDASWQAWVEDLLQACRWMGQRTDAPLWLWGLRAGCLLGAEVARRLDGAVSLLWWAPVASGRAALQQFLRLQTAAEMLNGRAGDEAKLSLLAQLQGGQAVEVAGYRLSPALADGLDQALLAPVPGVRRLAWLEVSSAELSPAAGQGVAAWRAAGCEVQARVVQGPAFWQTVEIEQAPLLIEASREVLLQPVVQAPAQEAAA